MPFPEKDYYKIIMELENEEYNNSNSNFGNNYNTADIAATSTFGNIHYHNYANNTGIPLFGLNQNNNVADNTEGIGLFGYSNNAGNSIFCNNANTTGTSLFGNTSESKFGNSLFGNTSGNKFSNSLFGNTSASLFGNKSTSLFGNSA